MSLKGCKNVYDPNLKYFRRNNFGYFYQNVTILVESIRLPAERFLKNHVESARNAFEREVERNIHLKNIFD